MFSPAFAGATLFPYTTLFRSRLTVVLTESESLPLVGSVGDWLPTEAVLVSVPGAALGLIWARIRTVLLSPLLRAPTGSVPVQLAPRLGSQAGPLSTQ